MGNRLLASKKLEPGLTWKLRGVVMPDQDCCVGLDLAYYLLDSQGTPLYEKPFWYSPVVDCFEVVLTI